MGRSETLIMLLLVLVVIVAWSLESAIRKTRRQLRATLKDVKKDQIRLRRTVKRIYGYVQVIEAKVGTLERRTRHPLGPPVTRLEELTPGDLVVHSQHGLGRYVGVERLVTDGEELDYLQLEYAHGGKLAHPVIRLDMLWRYGGDPQRASLDALGWG